MLLLVRVFLIQQQKQNQDRKVVWECPSSHQGMWASPRATHNEAAMDATPSKVGCILCQVHRSQPLHYPVVGPLHNF